MGSPLRGEGGLGFAPLRVAVADSVYKSLGFGGLQLMTGICLLGLAAVLLIWSLAGRARRVGSTGNGGGGRAGGRTCRLRMCEWGGGRGQQEDS